AGAVPAPAKADRRQDDHRSAAPLRKGAGRYLPALLAATERIHSRLTFRNRSPLMTRFASARDLVTLLLDRADRTPDLTVFSMASDDPAAAASLDARMLCQRALAVAARIQRERIGRGTVLLPCPTTLDTIVAFWGVVCAGAIAVPVPAPRRKHSLR